MTATEPATQDDVRQLERLMSAVTRLRGQVAQRIVGQDDVVEGILTAVLAGGHALLIGVPGLAKTLMVQTIAEALNLSFNRVQFTPDLMPSDITGTEIIEEDLTTGKRAFRFVHGPVFANVVLADEINRTPPKTQAALSPFLLSHDRVHASRFSAPYFLACCRYIEWSSYQANAHGTPDPLIRNHDLYWRLGRTDLERASAYRELFNTAFDPEFVEALRAATNGGWAMGCEAFKTQIAEALQRRVALLPKGRPPNDDLDDDRQISLLSR